MKKREDEEREENNIAKKQGVRKLSAKEAQVYPVLDLGACDIRRKRIHCIHGRS
jgi:hypothetical protein